MPPWLQVYIIGEVGIEEELAKLGIAYLGGPADNGKVPEMGKGCKVHHDPDVAAVVVGFDRDVNYYKMQYATLCIRENPGCEFIATNLDAVTHLTDAQEWAGNGAMVRSDALLHRRDLIRTTQLSVADHLTTHTHSQLRRRLCLAPSRT